jgi:cardiolipin synthase
MPAWLNLPNLLTLLRLLLAPWVIQSILSGRHLLALSLFALAALTDILDGAAARHFHVSTQAGAYLDPIADKCLMSGVFLALAAAHTVPWWLVIVVFGRDLYILMAVAVAMLFTNLRRFPPSVWGKASTFVQIVTATFCLSRNALELRPLDPLFPVILWICAAFTVWSGIHYTWHGTQVLRAH